MPLVFNPGCSSDHQESPDAHQRLRFNWPRVKSYRVLCFVLFWGFALYLLAVLRLFLMDSHC